MKKDKSTKGFTLIEILVTSTIVIVLMAIGIGSFRVATQGARNARRQADLEAVRQAMVLYKTNESTYPNGSFATAVGLLRGATPSYFSNPTPVDPSTGSTYPGSATNTNFCFCATLEPTGTTKGNSNSTTCAANTWVAGQYYCVSNP